jgi:hypothetical protein
MCSALGLEAEMAINFTQVIFSQTLQAWDVSVTTDPETAVNITSSDGYGMFAPNMVDAILPLFVVLQPLTPAALLSNFIWDQANTTTTSLNLIKTNAVNSGAVPNQLRVYALAPHSII